MDIRTRRNPLMVKIILEKSISVKNVADLHLLIYVDIVVQNHIIRYQKNKIREIDNGN